MIVYEPTKDEIEAAAKAMITGMFAPHELPVDEDIWWQYVAVARAALIAARSTHTSPKGAP